MTPRPEPCVGTGRFLLGSTLLYPKLPLLLYGIEIDPTLYRACLVNMAMFSNHPYFIICANTLMIDARHCGTDSEIWSLGNRWDPPDISGYYWKPEPAFKFSLADRAKEIAQRREQQPSPQPPAIEIAPNAFMASYIKRKKQT